MDHLITNCANIEVLFLCGKWADDFNVDEVIPIGYDISYLSRIQFHNLTRLALAGFEMLDGNFLIPVSIHLNHL